MYVYIIQIIYVHISHLLCPFICRWSSKIAFPTDSLNDSISARGNCLLPARHAHPGLSVVLSFSLLSLGMWFTCALGFRSSCQWTLGCFNPIKNLSLHCSSRHVVYFMYTWRICAFLLIFLHSQPQGDKGLLLLLSAS